jgi:hypothetical protein
MDLLVRCYAQSPCFGRCDFVPRSRGLSFRNSHTVAGATAALALIGLTTLRIRTESLALTDVRIRIWRSR